MLEETDDELTLETEEALLTEDALEDVEEAELLTALTLLDENWELLTELPEDSLEDEELDCAAANCTRPKARTLVIAR